MEGRWSTGKRELAGGTKGNGLVVQPGVSEKYSVKICLDKLKKGEEGQGLEWRQASDQ